MVTSNLTYQFPKITIKVLGMRNIAVPFFASILSITIKVNLSQPHDDNLLFSVHYYVDSLAVFEAIDFRYSFILKQCFYDQMYN